MDRLKRNWPILLLLIVTVIPVWKAVFAGEAIGPWDHIRHFAPFNGPKPETPWDVLQADGALQFYGWRDLVFESWRHGEVPVWNPYQLGGMPLMGNSQSGALYPPHVLMGVLHVPTPLAMGLLAWFHLFWAGLGVYMLTRRLGASQVGAAIGGVAFGLSPFMLAWTALPSVPTTVSWIPWLMWAITWALDPSRPAGAFRNKSLPVLAVALIFGCFLLSGHLQFIAYGLMALGLFVIFQALQTRKSGGKVAGWFLFPVAALALGIVVAADQLTSVYESTKTSHRKNIPSEEGYQAYLGGALKPAMLGEQLVPNVNGLPTKFSSSVEGLSEYWPGLAYRGANYAEAAMGQGPWIWALAIIGAMALWRQKRFGFLGIGVLGVLLAFGTPLNRLLYFLVPGWSGSGSPGRAGVLIVLALACLAAFSWEELTAEAKKPRTLAVIVGLAALVIAALSAMQGSSSAPEGVDATAFSTYVRASMQSQLPMALLGLALTLGLIYFIPKLRDRAGFAVIGGVALAGLLSWGFVVRTGEPIRQGEIQFDPGKRYAFVNEPWDLLGAAPALLPPDLATFLRVQDAAGYDSLLNKNTVARMNDMNGKDSAPPANGNIMFVKPSFDPKKLAEMGVSEVWSRIPLKQMGEPFETANGYAKYKLDGSLASGQNGEVKTEWISPTQLQVTATGPGEIKLKLSDAWNWKGTDGVTCAPVGNLSSIEGDSGEVDCTLPEGERTFRVVRADASRLPMIGFAVLLVLILNVLLSPIANYLFREKNTSTEPR